MEGHRSTSASSPVMVLVGTLSLPMWQAGMLKMCVSALKSEGWNLLKFERVKKTTTMSPLSYTSRCAQDDCDCQPLPNGGWEGDGHHHQEAGLHRWTGGVAPCKVFNCKKLQYARISCILYGGRCVSKTETVCDSAFYGGFCSNLSERLQGCWRCA